MDPLFSEKDRERVVAAIRDAEAATGAEIVPLVVLRSGAYPAAQWRGGVLAALLVLALATLLRGLSVPSLAPYLTDGAALTAALGTGLLGAGAARLFAPLTRALTPPDELDRTVYRRALQAFVEEQVFDTHDRTGILLFVSLAEHRIEVLADRGIDAQVDADAWADVSDHIRRGIEEDRLTRGLLDGLDCCRRVLHEHGLESSDNDMDNDQNELSDRLRHEDE